MTLEEYLQLVDTGIHRIEIGPTSTKISRKKLPAKKRKGKKDPKMSKALEKANEMGRKKSGGFKKGWSQGKIMKKAHQLRRKMR
tara:strand:+ start:359 stop:610 length:252 start_codon:yes stop_codon:yes gene_type:complete